MEGNLSKKLNSAFNPLKIPMSFVGMGKLNLQ